MSTIDLRSDTVTRPDAGMRAAMASADVGDDVFGEDPTINHLQEVVAEMLGKEAALFVPSGTMGNEICLKHHTRPGNEVLCEAGAHILNYESGAAGFLSGIQLIPVQGQRGMITPRQVEPLIRPTAYYYPQTAVIAIENTHNSAGGTVFPLDGITTLFELAQKRSLKLHIDGARIWNASAASGIPLAQYGAHCDSISVCFSKGLGAPVGSALAGSRELVAEAVRLRKIFGGGMRQAGILGAAVLYALENNLARLVEDHDNAKFLAAGLSEISGVTVDMESVQTNIVIFDIEETGMTTKEAVANLRNNGVLVVPFGHTVLRAVTHLDVTQRHMEAALEIFRQVFKPS